MVPCTELHTQLLSSSLGRMLHHQHWPMHADYAVRLAQAPGGKECLAAACSARHHACPTSSHVDMGAHAATAPAASQFQLPGQAVRSHMPASPTTVRPGRAALWRLRGVAVPAALVFDM